MRSTLVWTAIYLVLLVGIGYGAPDTARWPAFVALTLVASVVLARIVWKGRLTTGWVLGLAVAMRLLYVAWPPVLSDDAYRYIWDGMLQAEGVNPYLYRPDADALQAHRTDSLYQVLNSKSYYTVYPPVSQGVFLAGGLVYDRGWQVSFYVIKGILVLFELGALALLARMLTAPMLALYAWHPLVLIETAGQAHTESILLFFLALTLWLSRKQRPGWAGASLAMAGWTKLYPFVFFPFLTMRHGWRVMAAGAAVGLALLAPYWHPAFFSQIRESLDLYVRYFEFNAGLYYAVKKAFALFTGDDWSKQLGPAFRLLFLLAMGGLYVYDAFRKPPLARILLLATTAFLLLSTTVHPWYLMPALMLAVFEKRAPWHWHWLAAFSVGTYLRYVDGPYWLFVNLAWIGWFAIGLVVYRKTIIDNAFALMRFRANGKAKRIIHHLPRRQDPPVRVLDLGAAEGFVGEAIQKRTGAEVVLADVEDMNRTRLPLTRYDGRRLPFEDGAFDAVVLYFVLHHCAEPEQVFQEALRVSSGRVIIVESVFTTDAERRRLTRLDILANRIRSFGVMRHQEAHLAFRRAEEWKRLMLESGARLVAEGGWGNVLHRQHLFVLDKNPIAPSVDRRRPRPAS
ncbi:MAG: methyltransferase domain-containing protein [Rhodothermales bacterium]